MVISRKDEDREVLLLIIDFYYLIFKNTQVSLTFITKRLIKWQRNKTKKRRKKILKVMCSKTIPYECN